MGVAPNGWFIREHPIKMGDLGAPLKMENTFEGTQNEGVLKCKSHEYYSWAVLFFSLTYSGGVLSHGGTQI